jgi:hypothetical protein
MARLPALRLLVPLVLAGQLAVVPGTVAAHAAGLPVLTGDVTLTSSRTGYVRVRVTRNLDVQGYAYHHPPTFTGAGPVGFALLPDALGSVASNLVVVRQIVNGKQEVLTSPATGDDPVTGKRDAPFLRPGTYRLFLLTRGGGSVRFAAPGQPVRAQHLTATNRVPWALHEEDVPKDPTTGYGPVTFSSTLDFDGKQPGHVFSWLSIHNAASAYSYDETCYYNSWSQSARSQPGCMGSTGPGGAFERYGPVVDKWDTSWGGGIYREAPGEAGTRVTYRNAGGVASGHTLMFFLPEA